MVQTFLVEETKELIYEDDKLQEWKQKCEELGLTEQLGLASPEKSPIPFEPMDNVTQRVYETLCPSKVNYRNYKKSTIPLEVLGLIHLAVNENYFNEIEIWYDDKTPDPVVVGKIKEGAYQWNLFTIARWGDVLRPFDELKELAINRYTNSAKIQLRSKIADLNNRLDNVETNTLRYFDAQAQGYDVTGF